MLLNLLLRNYLSEHLVSQADLLVSKTTFPESAPNSEAARYMYYLGRIKAIQLDYSEADQHLFAAIRKAPANAIGFLEHVSVWRCGGGGASTGGGGGSSRLLTYERAYVPACLPA